MDSPESRKIVASSSSASPAVQESPFFNYLRTLSPIKPVKAAHVVQGFPEFNIPPPPPVFTSPRLNPQPETIFLKRSKYSQSSNTDSSGKHENRGPIFAAGSDISERPVKQFMIGLVPCSQKGCASKGLVQVKPCSPSGCVDEYLADPVEVDSANSYESADLCATQVNDAPEELQSGFIRSNEETVKVDDNGDQMLKDMEIGTDVQFTSSEKTEDLHGKSLVVVKPGKQKAGEGQSMECTDIISEKINDIKLSNSSPELSSGAQNVQHVGAQVVTGSSLIMLKKKKLLFHDKRSIRSKPLHLRDLQDVNLQSSEGGCEGERDQNTQLLPESLHIVQAFENHNEHQGVISSGSVENRTDCEEDGQHQRGTRRRCLQFEASEARRKSIDNSHCHLNPANIVHCSKLPANPTNVEILESSCPDLATSSNNCTVNSSQLLRSKSSLCSVETHVDKLEKSVRNGGNSAIKAPLPSGIGLHLNSIVNAAAMGCTSSPIMNPSKRDYPSAQREKRDKSPSVLKHHLHEESKSSSLPTIVAGTYSAQNDGNQPKTQAIVAVSSATYQFPHDNIDRFEELNQLSPNKKRKRIFTVEDEGCKRCNCRRSKCLKLYCECFAAGIYCAEPCACQECFNKPEYEDMVLGTRQQIESRNPLAFAPRVVRRATGSPANTGEDINRVTPSSARHKRGCNCKKSMCLKKYCECYQAGVGCSAGCRCNGCKNVYGIKDGYGEINEVVCKKADDESWEDVSDGKLVMEARSNSVHPEHSHNLTPLTPSFQRSNHGKDVPKSRLPGRRCLTSPESDNYVLSSYSKSPKSPRYINSHDKHAKMGEGSLDLVFYDQEMEFSATGRVDQFSPRWDGLEDICDLTPLPQPPSRAGAISSSSNNRDCAKVSRVQIQGSVHLSGSLRWRSSPITPMPWLGGSKLRQEPESDVGYDILEDDTPDILKDTHTPIKAVKASSPNQKRVSPPHSHLHELRSSSSPVLRSGRKFVLQSISSFPSLTPYSDPKGSNSNK